MIKRHAVYTSNTWLHTLTPTQFIEAGWIHPNRWKPLHLMGLNTEEEKWLFKALGSHEDWDAMLWVIYRKHQARPFKRRGGT